ncbi:transcription-repair coupling factor [Methylonatrum kenyense]|uniref:transcription-repair coupling factor n=1 Tax=Methylonatrum kenyense TaxID=455253 RepID=UPI0020BE6442|nr:transcription-repair coupling factor [Methylonatrum kenyense]MCK8516447.1 transcription-repair coupling factor [Methylonatrum kenyense]
MSREHCDPLTPVFPRKPGRALYWSGLEGSLGALALWQMADDPQSGLVLAVTASSQDAQRLETELRFYSNDASDRILVFPDWETLPYDIFSPHQDIVSQRLATLARLPDCRDGILIVPIGTLLQRLAPRSFLDGHALNLAIGDRLDMAQTRGRLEQAGYRCVPEVGEHGEFAVRGALLDLFPMGSERPYRLDLFDDEIETIRLFDPETQISDARVERISLLPGREFPVNEEAIARFRGAFRSCFEGDPTRSLIYREVSEGTMPSGIEYYLPLFFEQTATLFDYLPDDILIHLDHGVFDAADELWHEIGERYEQRRHDQERPLLPPNRVFLDPREIRARTTASRAVICNTESAEVLQRGPDPDQVRFASEPLPELGIIVRDGEQRQAIGNWVARQERRVLFVAETAGHREALLESLARQQIRPREFRGWQQFLESDQDIGITISPMERGGILPQSRLALVTEAALSGNRAQQRRRRRRQERDPALIIRDLNDLRIGAPVVHEEHGVGRYHGLQTLDVGEYPTEFLTLEYAGGDKLYVPVAALQLISRYSGADEDHAPLHRLGSGQWEKAKRKAAEKVRDVAAELLDLYARRAARRGTSIESGIEEYAAFAAAFPFEETPDQQDAIDAVIQDLASSQPMDRVVCGDVGFGKTEVAMRAAFVAVQGGYQVAILVPTTLLAQQHYQNFRDRFADWPVRIGLLSRFGGSKAKAQTINDFQSGDLDIVIGTHKLLQSDLKANNLGLVIIDEEHRFGVQHKERLKQLRAEVDLLTLTATPIPRTLNMALSGMRDLSVITTPPARRLAVKTFVSEWNDALIQEACLRELKRGGQVYLLHNDVKSIDRAAEQLQELVPQARIGVAHGQLPERELEQVMLDFYHQRHNVLVCSTIIESGIDVPTANTIIINRADRFGLAQLHQMRGRVGRSHHRAYAYLIAPPRKLMTADAVKRLDALAAHEDLGVGFTLASHDLEIRGAGELLGAEQSGQISEVGFTLYNDLLDRAVKDLKQGREPELDKPLHQGTEIELRIPALLPEGYLPDVHTRLVLYKRIANAADHEALKDLQVEMIDRFGLLPAAAKNLFRVTELKLEAEPLGLKRIELGENGGQIVFGAGTQVDPGALVQLVQGSPASFRLEGQERLKVERELPDADQRFALARELIDALRLKEAA